MNDDDKPCPFCGSTDLDTNTWWTDEDGNEVDGVQCLKCHAGAPASVWNERAA